MTNGKSKEGERVRTTETCCVPSIRWRQRAETQAKGTDNKKNAYTPPGNGERRCETPEEKKDVTERREAEDGLSNNGTDIGINTGICFTGYNTAILRKWRIIGLDM